MNDVTQFKLDCLVECFVVALAGLLYSLAVIGYVFLGFLLYILAVAVL